MARTGTTIPSVPMLPDRRLMDYLNRLRLAIDGLSDAGGSFGDYLKLVSAELQTVTGSVDFTGIVGFGGRTVIGGNELFIQLADDKRNSKANVGGKTLGQTNVDSTIPGAYKTEVGLTWTAIGFPAFSCSGAPSNDPDDPTQAGLFSGSPVWVDYSILATSTDEPPYPTAFRATADRPSRGCAGIVAGDLGSGLDTMESQRCFVILFGPKEEADWTPVTGTADLIVGSTYYVDAGTGAAAGLLTTTPGDMPVGYAVNERLLFVNTLPAAAASQDIDGGSASSTYLTAQNIDGGGA